MPAIFENILFTKTISLIILDSANPSGRPNNQTGDENNLPVIRLRFQVGFRLEIC